MRPPLTNHYSLPDGFYKAVSNDGYSPGESDITVTQLIGPPQIRMLTKEFNDQIQEDCSDFVWSALGTAFHNLMEGSETEASVEKRLYMDVMGKKLGGQYDRLDKEEGVLQDYKVTSVWKYIFAKKDVVPYEEWTQQLNVLAHLAEHNGTEIKKLEIIVIFRDYSKSEKLRNDQYPPIEIMKLEMPLWDSATRQAYIDKRMEKHLAAENGEAIHCTKSDVWLRDEKFAVMKEGVKKAKRLFATDEHARAYMAEQPLKDQSKLFVQHRVGTPNRCKDYCAVSEFCPQYGRYLAKLNKG